MKQIDYASLTLYLFKAQVKSDINKYYLGTLWWFLEPLLYVVVFYFVFLNFRNGSDVYLMELICGLVVWKWISSCINQGANSISQAKGIISSFNVNPVVFPLASLFVNSFKFFVILVLALSFFCLKNVLDFSGLWPLFVWGVVALVIVFSYLLLFATFMPFLPDLRIIIGNFMMLAMFVSGVIVPLSSMPESAQSILTFNPFAIVIDGIRKIILHGESIDYLTYFNLLIVHFFIFVIGFYRVCRLKGEFPKRVI